MEYAAPKYYMHRNNVKSLRCKYDFEEASVQRKYYNTRVLRELFGKQVLEYPF